MTAREAFAIGAPTARGTRTKDLSKKIYVGNLPFSSTEEDIRQLFATYGEVHSVALPVDRDTGRPRGFGFVEMEPDDALKAIQALDGKDYGGRLMRVNEAREGGESRGPRRDMPPRRGGGYGGR